MDPIQVLEDQRSKLQIVRLTVAGSARSQYSRAIAEMDAAIDTLKVAQFAQELETL